MSRPLRIEYCGAWYHIMNRGRRQEAIFSDRIDYDIFLSLLMETSEMWNVRVTAYCLMTNHYHILLQTPDANISRSMRHLNSLYTQKYNRRHGYDGPLFRGRYKSILVPEDSYLLQLVRYIHKNPVKAGLVSEMGNYPWSSYNGYLSDAQKWSWLYKEIIFDQIATSGQRRRKAFIALMHEEDTQEIVETFSKKHLPSIMGPEGFITRIKEIFYLEKRSYEVPQSKRLAPEPHEIIDAVCIYYNVVFDDLQVSRRGRFNRPRNVAIYLLRSMRGDDLNRIKGLFHIKAYSTVSSVIQNIARLKQSDKIIRKEILAIKALLVKPEEPTV